MLEQNESAEIVNISDKNLNLFDTVKMSIFENSSDGIESFYDENLFDSIFLILEDSSTNTLIKKKRIVEKFLSDNNIDDLSELQNQFQSHLNSIQECSAILNNTFFSAVKNIVNGRLSPPIGILEIMLKSKIEKDLRSFDETCNSNSK